MRLRIASLVATGDGRLVMGGQGAHHDRERSVSWRGVQWAAKRNGIQLEMYRDAGGWVASASRPGDGHAPVVKTGPTQADAGWQAVREVLRRMRAEGAFASDD
jgi:hypothetical protein